jgi:hypothetical protein
VNVHDREDEKRSRAAALDRYRRRCAAEVRARWAANGNLCEGCQRQVHLVEVAHLMGRGIRANGIGELWASAPALCAALCCARTWGDRVGCHESFDRYLDPAVRSGLLWAAAGRLAEQLHLPRPEFDDPADAILSLIRTAEERHIPPPGDRG